MTTKGWLWTLTLLSLVACTPGTVSKRPASSRPPTEQGSSTSPTMPTDSTAPAAPDEPPQRCPTMDPFGNADFDPTHAEKASALLDSDDNIAKYDDAISNDIARQYDTSQDCGDPGTIHFSPCPPLSPTPTSNEVVATLQLPTSFRESERISGKLTVTNNGTVDLAAYGSGSGIGALIIDPATGEQVGKFRGVMTADLHTYSFPSGGTGTARILVAATGCTGGSPPVPPGRYIVRASVGLVAPGANSPSRSFDKPLVTATADTFITITTG